MALCVLARWERRRLVRKNLHVREGVVYRRLLGNRSSWGLEQGLLLRWRQLVGRKLLMLRGRWQLRRTRLAKKRLRSSNQGRRLADRLRVKNVLLGYTTSLSSKSIITLGGRVRLSRAKSSRRY